MMKKIEGKLEYRKQIIFDDYYIPNDDVVKKQIIQIILNDLSFKDVIISKMSIFEENLKKLKLLNYDNKISENEAIFAFREYIKSLLDAQDEYLEKIKENILIYEKR